jgi:hypothetical protein
MEGAPSAMWDGILVDAAASLRGSGAGGALARLLIEGPQSAAPKAPEGLSALLTMLLPPSTAPASTSSPPARAAAAPAAHSESAAPPSPRPPVPALSLEPHAALLVRATVAPLSAPDAEALVRALVRAPGALITGAGVEPYTLPRLVEANPAVAVEAVACLLSRPEQTAPWGGLAAFLAPLIPTLPTSSGGGAAVTTALPSPSPRPGGARRPEATAQGPPTALSLQLLEVMSRLLLPDAARPPTPAPSPRALPPPPAGGAPPSAAASSARDAALAAASAAGIHPVLLPGSSSEGTGSLSLTGLTTGLPLPTALSHVPGLVPSDFIVAFCSRTLHAAAAQPDKPLQARQVRLVAVFLTSLVRGGVIPAKGPGEGVGGAAASVASWEDEADSGETAFEALRAEMGAWAVDHVRHKEAAALFRVLSAK